MPVTKTLPYQWYDTPNIRVGTFADFEVLARRIGLRSPRRFGLHDGRAGATLAEPARQRGGVQVRAWRGAHGGIARVRWQGGDAASSVQATA